MILTAALITLLFLNVKHQELATDGAPEGVHVGLTVPPTYSTRNETGAPPAGGAPASRRVIEPVRAR